MVVTSSRLHAVTYQQALTRYCREHGYDIGVLVAFSGTLANEDDPNGQGLTESNMNGFPESQTAEFFAEDGHHILVVAEKYQTGFDQPLLYAMYVDKSLSGLAAVQTLSRLNRPCDGKDGTFVLDFRNEAGEIRDSFAPWYAATVSPPTDPNLMYDTRNALDPFGVLWPEEVERAVALLVVPDKRSMHGRVHAALTPSIDRFRALDAREQDAFRDALGRFTRTYAFLSQVVTFTDVNLERDYMFCKALAAFIRPAGTASLDLGSEVELTHLRTERTFAGSVALDPETHGEVSTVFASTSSGGGRHRRRHYLDPPLEKPARATVAVGEQARERGDRDLRRGAGADVQSDRAVHPCDVAWCHAECLKRRDVRGRVARVAQHADPACLGGERVAQHGAKLIPVMVGDHHVGAVEVRWHLRHDGEAGHGGAGRAGRVRFHQQDAEAGIRSVSQQEPGDRGCEHRHHRAVSKVPTRGGAGDRCGAVRDRAGVVLISHKASLLHGV
jgi:hypothetical protein